MNGCDWHDLRVGDAVVIVRWPTEFDRATLHTTTTALYEWLIQSHAVIKVVEIEPTGIPIAEIVREDNGNDVWEYIGLNHSGIARAE
jgi:hypothetical protein